ncbi:TetR/AcrR family transcriptional regulator [Streptomyces sp. NPDC055607]
MNAVGMRAVEADQVLTTDQRIKAVAVSSFARLGYAATSIRDIARGVGIKTASMYHFFDSKEALLVEIIREGQNALNEMTKRMLEGVDRPEDRLSLLVSSLAGCHGINQTVSRVTDRELRVFESGSPIYLELVANRDLYETLWADTIGQGVEQGIFQVRDARVARLGLMASCTGLNEWYRPDGPSSLPDICRSLVDLALSAVQAERDGSPVTVDDVRILDPDQLTRVEWEPTPNSLTTEVAP